MGIDRGKRQWQQRILPLDRSLLEPERVVTCSWNFRKSRGKVSARPGCQTPALPCTVRRRSRRQHGQGISMAPAFTRTRRWTGERHGPGVSTAAGSARPRQLRHRGASRRGARLNSEGKWRSRITPAKHAGSTGVGGSTACPLRTSAQANVYRLPMRESRFPT